MPVGIATCYVSESTESNSITARNSPVIDLRVSHTVHGAGTTGAQPTFIHVVNNSLPSTRSMLSKDGQDRVFKRAGA